MVIESGKQVVSVIQRTVRRAVQYMRFGRITSRVTATAGHGVNAEIEYLDHRGVVVGYWAYGSWQPGLPYKG